MCILSSKIQIHVISSSLPFGFVIASASLKVKNINALPDAIQLTIHTARPTNQFKRNKNNMTVCLTDRISWWRTQESVARQCSGTFPPNFYLDDFFLHRDGWRMKWRHTVDVDWINFNFRLHSSDQVNHIPFTKRLIKFNLLITVPNPHTHQQINCWSPTKPKKVANIGVPCECGR